MSENQEDMQKGALKKFIKAKKSHIKMKKDLFFALAFFILLVASSSGSAVPLETECGFISPFIGVVKEIAQIKETNLVTPVLDDANFVSLGYKLGSGENKYINIEDLDQRVLTKYLNHEDSSIFLALFRNQDNFMAAPGIPEQLGMIIREGDIFMQTKTETTLCGNPFMRAYDKKGNIRFLYSQHAYPYKFRDFMITPKRGNKTSCVKNFCKEEVIFEINEDRVTLLPGSSSLFNKHGLYSINLIRAESQDKEETYSLEYALVFDHGTAKEEENFLSKILSWVKSLFSLLLQGKI